MQKIDWEIELSYSNSPEYCLFSKCFEPIYVISHNQSYWAVVEHILCYLKEAPEREIFYKHGHTRIECFSNAN